MYHTLELLISLSIGYKQNTRRSEIELLPEESAFLSVSFCKEPSNLNVELIMGATIGDTRDILRFHENKIAPLNENLHYYLVRWDYNITGMKCEEYLARIVHTPNLTGQNVQIVFILDIIVDRIPGNKTKIPFNIIFIDDEVTTTTTELDEVTTSISSPLSTTVISTTNSDTTISTTNTDTTGSVSTGFSVSQTSLITGLVTGLVVVSSVLGVVIAMAVVMGIIATRRKTKQYNSSPSPSSDNSYTIASSSPESPL